MVLNVHLHTCMQLITDLHLLLRPTLQHIQDTMLNKSKNRSL